MSEHNDLIFPVFKKAGSVEISNGGLTKREYFALQIFLNQPNMSEVYITESIYKADELLKQLKKHRNK